MPDIVFKKDPYIPLIWTPPLPTIPKFAAVPKASKPGWWGDHLTQVKADGYFEMNCLKGFSIIIFYNHKERYHKEVYTKSIDISYFKDFLISFVDFSLTAFNKISPYRFFCEESAF